MIESMRSPPRARDVLSDRALRTGKMPIPQEFQNFYIRIALNAC
ncbi:MAG: hypothetical protein AB1589_39740 [Cyanobacteriota bacterium]